MTRIVDWYFHVLKFLVVVFVMTMVVLVLGNVILRYGFNSGITVSEELSRWAFVWLTFTGGVVAMREHTHLGMDTVVSKLPVIGKKVCYVLSHIIMIGCVVLFINGAYQQTVINLDVGAPASGLSSAIFYGVGLFFGVPALLLLIGDLLAMLTGKISDDDLVQVRESEEELDEEKLKELQLEMERETERLAASRKK